MRLSDSAAYEIAVHMAIELQLHQFMTRRQVEEWIRNTKRRLMRRWSIYGSGGG